MLRLAVVAYLLVVLMFSLVERWLLYPAPRYCAADWLCEDLPHEDVHFTAEDGTMLHGWYVPHQAPKAVVLFCPSPDGKRLAVRLGGADKAGSDEILLVNAGGTVREVPKPKE